MHLYNQHWQAKNNYFLMHQSFSEIPEHMTEYECELIDELKLVILQLSQLCIEQIPKMMR